MGLHFRLFQTVSIPFLHRYTRFQTFNPIHGGFLIVCSVYTSKEVKYGGIQLFGGRYSSASNIFHEVREEEKVTGDYTRGIG